MKGHTFKRCACGTIRDAEGNRINCPKRHGTWVYVHELQPGPSGRRRQVKVGGFATEREAREALNDSLARLARGTYVELGRKKVDAYLDDWIEGKTALRNTTRRSYQEIIEIYLKPGLGHIRLSDLRSTDIEALYAAIRLLGRPDVEVGPGSVLEALIQARHGKVTKPMSDARIRRVHATLRVALNSAVRRHLIASNPASHVELPSGRRPRAVVWTDEEVQQWKRRGDRPPVAVWTAEQTGEFLDAAASDRLYPLFHLVAYRGLRRGEVVGLRWRDVDLERGLLRVSQQVVQLGWQTEIADPKTHAGIRVVPLDEQTIAVLRRWRAVQAAERLEWGEAWVDTGLVFTKADGTGIHPASVSARFRILSNSAELPPIRLHDLRHTAASLALAAGVPMKVVSELLGHSSLAITADTYTSVLPEVAIRAAEAVAEVIPRKRGVAASEGTPTPPTRPS